MATSDPDGSSDTVGNQSPSQGSSQLLSHNLRKSIPTSKEDTLRITSGTVNQLSKAKLHLVSKGYLAQGVEISFLGLSLILFQITTEAKLPLLADNIKSVAFLLEVLSIDSLSDHLTTSIESKLNVVIESLALTASNLDDQQQELQENTAGLVNAALQIAETTNNATLALSKVMGDIRHCLETMPQAPIHTLAPTSTVTSPLTPAAINNLDIDIALYVETSRSTSRHRDCITLPILSLLEGLLASLHLLDLVVVFVLVPDHIDIAGISPEPQSLHSLSELELVSKARLAYESIRLTDNLTPADLCFVGAKKLSAGNIVLDLNSPQAAMWLKQPDVRASFMQNFSAVSTFKDFEYQVLVEFIPITFSPDSQEALEHIKGDSGAQTGRLVWPEWAKPLE
ncbi:hypothetical protein PILCRDRAFT_15205 [Piloderma croceum F 1598]|uniref:Uncharacterized protein n=1 Tax=Piloderma croceum (strain F 1598) TaxID=765440 RepID=A0A0C3EZW0_PILCF|nr:hypothetical protein PILCRDRAFT_15205 [Piloderma croceum F 1598]